MRDPIDMGADLDSTELRTRDRLLAGHPERYHEDTIYCHVLDLDTEQIIVVPAYKR